MEEDVLTGQHRLCPLQVQNSQGVVECGIIVTQPEQVKLVSMHVCEHVICKSVSKYMCWYACQ